MSGINLRPAEEQHSSGDDRDTHSPVPSCSSAFLFHDDAPLVLRQSWVFRPCPLLGVRESPQYSALPDITALGVRPGCSSRTLLPSVLTSRPRSPFPLPSPVDLGRSSLVLGRGGDVRGLVLCWEPAREENTRPFCTSPPPVWGPGDHPQGSSLLISPFFPPLPALSDPDRLHQSRHRLSFSVLPSCCTLLLAPPVLMCLLLHLVLLSSTSSSSLSSSAPYLQSASCHPVGFCRT